MSFTIRIISLILAAGYVIKNAEDEEWKIRNGGIILAAIAFGTGLGLLIGYLIQASYELSLVYSGILWCGYMGVAIAGAMNYWRSGGIYKGKKRKPKRDDRTVV